MAWAFLIYCVNFDGARPPCPTRKYMDDTTLMEILSHNHSSCVDVYLTELHQWSIANNMLINEHKTKEMITTLVHTLTIQIFLILNVLIHLNYLVFMLQ